MLVNINVTITVTLIQPCELRGQDWANEWAYQAYLLPPMPSALIPPPLQLPPLATS